VNIVFVEVYRILKERGVRVVAAGVPMIEIDGHPYAYACDNKGNWMHLHASARDWTHLATGDSNTIAGAIHAHLRRHSHHE
jgi:hypothetical protein